MMDNIAALKVFGEPIVEYIGSYQGEVVGLIKYGHYSKSSDHEFGAFEGWYGSCTHCDMWEGAGYEGPEAVRDAFVTTASSITWFETASEALKYLASKADEDSWLAPDYREAVTTLVTKAFEKGWLDE